MMPSNHLILCRSLLLLSQSFPASGSFPLSRLFASGGQSTGVSTLASVLPMNVQGWFPLRLTGLLSLLSKGLSRVFPALQFKSISSSAFSLHYSPTFTSVPDYWKSHTFDCMGLIYIHIRQWLHISRGPRIMVDCLRPGLNLKIWSPWTPVSKGRRRWVF